MIYYLVARRHVRTMHDFLAGCGKPLVGRIRILLYEDLFSGAPVRLPVATYIFTSLGTDLGSRNPPSRERGMVGDLHRKLVEACGPARVLNDPLNFMSRFELLRALERRGINRFAAYRIDGAEIPRRFPVFLREEFGTLWKTPSLLRDEAEYQVAVKGAKKDKRLLAIEYRDTADSAGFYRKYGCFVVGDHIVPRHLFFSRDWWVKHVELCEPWMVREEWAYVESADPHEALMREVASLANLTYGRIDYTMLDGRPQIWEINITPAMVTDPAMDFPVRSPVHENFTTRFAQALDAIDPPGR
jgi:hypothetical protein